MPLVKIAGRLVFFAHVPKCAGVAVGAYLRARFGPLAFEDREYLRRPQAQRWSRTSPQHIDAASLARVFPETFLDVRFAVVRHPVTRLASVYHFQRDVEQTIPAGTGFSAWLEELEEWRSEEPFLFDNHVRPMDDLVPAGAEVFRVEDGFDGLIAWLDALAGKADGPRSIAMKNRRRAAARGPLARPGPADRALIARLFAADFARFGYAPESVPETGEGAPSVPGGEAVQ